MNLLAVLRQNGRLVAFGFFMCFCSSVGQTFFIALFNGELRRAFGLSHGDIGAMYAAGTIASALTLVFAGQLVDRVRLSTVVTIVLLGLAVSAAGMGVVWTAIGLPFVFYGLRLFGQGLAGHTAMTAMGRYFDATRGRAISLASLGYPAGEALLPTLVVAGMAIVAWQSLWMMIAGVVMLALPVALFLLKGKLPVDQAPAENMTMKAGTRHWRLGEVLRDAAMWLRMPTVLGPAFISTGLFFHQVHLAEEKGWPLALIAGSFTAYAVSSFATKLVAGTLVDRFTARRMLPWVLFPLMFSCFALVVSSSSIVAPVFMVLSGLTSGLYGIAGTAIWPELYGTRYLGSLKGFSQASMVLASGIAPVAFGVLIDRNISMEAIAFGCAVWCILASGLAVIANRR
jgi:sugar phosphate permease